MFEYGINARIGKAHVMATTIQIQRGRLSPELPSTSGLTSDMNVKQASAIPAASAGLLPAGFSSSMVRSATSRPVGMISRTGRRWMLGFHPHCLPGGGVGEESDVGEETAMGGRQLPEQLSRLPRARLPRVCRFDRPGPWLVRL